MAKILLPVFGSRGDVQPILALALELQARGHRVCVAAPPDFKNWIESFQVPAVAQGLNARELIDHYGPQLSNPLRMFKHLGPLIRQHIAQQYAELMPLAQGYDMIVSSSLQFAAFSAAEYYGIPYHYLVYCPNLMPSSAHMPMIYPFPQLTPQIHRLCWWNEIKAWNLLIRPVINRQRADWNLPAIDEIYAAILTPRPLLVSYAELAPHGAADGDYPALQLAALHLPASTEPLEPELEDFLAQGPAPVYLGFGSMNDGRGAEMTRMIMSLAGPSQRFVLSQGWAGLGGQNPSEYVYVTGPVAHELLFPRMRAVIHHGGAGTTSMAARSGVPQLILPHLLDQYYWGHQIYINGLGPRPLAKFRLNPRRFQHKLRQLMRPSFQLRAEALGRRLRCHNGVHMAAEAVLASLRS